MTLLQIMHAILNENPHNLVHVDMDNFVAYEYWSLPKHLQDAAMALTDSEDKELSEFEDQYLQALRDYSIADAKEEMRKAILPLSPDQVLPIILNTMKEATESEEDGGYCSCPACPGGILH